MQEVLIVIDMQKDFLTGELANPLAETVTKNVREKIQSYRAQGKEVIFTRDTHGDDYMNTQEGKNLPVPHCIKGTDGWELVEGLAKDTDKIFNKPTFGSIELAQYVKEKKFSSVELVGVCTDICVVSNALLIKAHCPEISVSVDGACCAGVTKESHDAALKTMSFCQVLVQNANN
jgi:nicotinamidase-related amidase